MSLCKYKNSLGVPGKGIHSYRVFNIAIADVIMTIIGGYFISRTYKTSFFFTCMLLFILGIVLHRLFCVRTTIDKLLFP
jgi:uncharacterized membrane protein